MRLLPILLSAAAAVHAASSPDLADTIIGALNQIVVLTRNVTGEIADLNSADKDALTQALTIQSATSTLVYYIGNATVRVQGFPDNLTNSEAQTLGANTQGLAYAVNASIATLIQKKPDFNKLGIAPLVITSLQQQKNYSRDFTAAVLAHVPPSLNPISEALSAQPAMSIQQGIDCFSGKNETCNPNIVNATRTLDAAQDTGAIPKSAADRTMSVAGYVVVLGAAFVAFAVGL